ncbi:MAG: 3'(2'),5'-bisphosphate nucleotidase CysQ [Jiangellaceae bacterium]
MDQRTDAELARRLAAEAGALLLQLREKPSWSDADLTERKRAGDSASQRLLAAELAAGCSGDVVLSEEAADDQSRLAADRVWIIDPLDGTREFAEGRSDWAVHVALWREGELAAGAVALPGLATTLSTAEPPQRPVPAPGPVRIAVSRSRAPAVATRVATRLAAELVPMGSAGYKVAAVVRGEVDAYVHAGGQYEWDSAAPVAVARACGLHTSRLDGSALRYNQPEPHLPDLVVCRPVFADALLAAISENVVQGTVR